jgi:LacI family transcriptional regulator
MKKTFRIAVIVFSEPDFFWKQVEYGVMTAFNELKPLGVAVDYFTTDIMHPEEQLELIKSLPSRGYHAVAVAPNSPQLLQQEIGRLSDSKFPIIIINVEIPSTNHLCYIGCDYIQSGIMAAELFAKFTGEEGQIAILALKEQVSAIEQRITGFRKELSNHPKMGIKQVLQFSRTAEDVYDGVRKLLKDSPDTECIYVSFGALEQTAHAIQDSKLVKKPLVVGYDLNQDIYNYLKQGIITASICHEPFQQGYFAVKVLYRYLNQGIMPSSSIMYTKLEAILASNAKYYLNDRMHLEMFNE